MISSVNDVIGSAALPERAAMAAGKDDGAAAAAASAAAHAEGPAADTASTVSAGSSAPAAKKQRTEDNGDDGLVGPGPPAPTSDADDAVGPALPQGKPVKRRRVGRPLALLHREGSAGVLTVDRLSVVVAAPPQSRTSGSCWPSCRARGCTSGRTCTATSCCKCS